MNCVTIHPGTRTVKHILLPLELTIPIVFTNYTPNVEYPDCRSSVTVYQIKREFNDKQNQITSSLDQVSLRHHRFCADSQANTANCSWKKLALESCKVSYFRHRFREWQFRNSNCVPWKSLPFSHWSFELELVLKMHFIIIIISFGDWNVAQQKSHCSQDCSRKSPSNGVRQRTWRRTELFNWETPANSEINITWRAYSDDIW